MLTTFNEADMSAIFALRKEYKETFKEKHGVSLGFMSFFTLAVVRALELYPTVNSMIDGKEMITYDFKDISIAVSGPKGLMVPVIRNAENLSFRGVESEVKRLAIRARDGQITVDEMTGGTFTISEWRRIWIHAFNTHYQSTAIRYFRNAQYRRTSHS